MKLYYFVLYGSHPQRSDEMDQMWLVRANNLDEAANLFVAQLGIEMIPYFSKIDVVYEIGMDTGVSAEPCVLAGPIIMHAICQGWKAWRFDTDEGWRIE